MKKNFAQQHLQNCVQEIWVSVIRKTKNVQSGSPVIDTTTTTTKGFPFLSFPFLVSHLLPQNTKSSHRKSQRKMHKSQIFSTEQKNKNRWVTHLLILPWLDAWTSHSLHQHRIHYLPHSSPFSKDTNTMRLRERARSLLLPSLVSSPGKLTGGAHPGRGPTVRYPDYRSVGRRRNRWTLLFILLTHEVAWSNYQERKPQPMDEKSKSIQNLNDFLLFILCTLQRHTEQVTNMEETDNGWKNSKVSNNFHLLILSTQEEARNNY